MVKRSWYWGPQPNTGQILEDYAEGPGGQHLVQYFDKSRMEINNPNADPNNPFYVTNGLLTRELISGQMQTGNVKFAFRYPARIPLSGGVPGPGSITYSSLGYVIEQEAPDSVGKPVVQRIERDGYPESVTAQIDGPPNPEQYGVKYAYYESATRHNIPEVFFEFLNASGPVVEGGKQRTAQLSVPYFYVTGYPISEAFWVNMYIDGYPMEVMLQVYERRLLTYAPDAPEGYKVQMGNVGQHYYDWRYNGAGKPDALLNRCGIVPERGFGKLYKENEVVRTRLDCIDVSEKGTTVKRQTFQRGQMIAVTVQDLYTKAYVEDIYVLYTDGRVWTFNWVEPYAIPAAPSDAPDGLQAPSGTLLKVWQEYNLLNTLGWATGPADVQENDPANPGRGSVVAYFDGGLMVYPNLAARQIYVLYASSGTLALRARVRQAPSYYHADHWLVFADTFTDK
ncbi:MAG: hypothetical protein M3441_08130 [Chloroflexota bacterium]|nr:hypothetical protein [Chloroflexota bacterium]